MCWLGFNFNNASYFELILCFVSKIEISYYIYSDQITLREYSAVQYSEYNIFL